MVNNMSIRRGWLRAMYIYTIFAAGGLGLGVLFFPRTILPALRVPAQNPVTLGLYGSVALASALVAILALGSPLKFVPLLLLQLVYKPIWLAVFAIPLFFKGQFPFYVVFNSVVFITFIIGDLIAIPFSYLFSKE
jgi:hypothetical protein